MKALTLAAILLAAPASAEAFLSLSLPLGAGDGVVSARYVCEDGTEYAVRYVNSGPNSLALIALPEGERVFVNVIAASGARYVAGAYEWWSRGETARLSNAQAPNEETECAVR